MDENSILESLKQAVIDCDEEKAKKFAQVALEAGLDPLTAIEKGLASGLHEVGQAFDRGDVFLPDLLMSAETMKAGSAILEAKIKETTAGSVSKEKTIVIGTVRDDIHDIGKSLVGLMLFCNGWNVIDLGRDVDTEDFIEAVEQNGAKLLGLSSLLTTTAPEMANVIRALEQKGLRAKVKVMVGGGAITAEYASKIGADAHGINASDAVKKAAALLAAV